jgi:hypothetical protein
MDGLRLCPGVARRDAGDADAGNRLRATTVCAQETDCHLQPWRAAAGSLKQGLLWLKTQQDPPHILPVTIGDHHVLPYGMDIAQRALQRTSVEQRDTPRGVVREFHHLAGGPGGMHACEAQERTFPGGDGPATLGRVPGEQGDAGDYGSTPVQWPGSFLGHSNPEKPLYACQTATRHVQR